MNRGGIAVLPSLRTLLAIYQKSQVPSFREVMDSFVLLAYVGLAASRTITSLFERYFRSISPFGTNEKSDFYEVWQHHKQLKTMETSEAFYEGYIHQLQPELTNKIR